MEKQVYEAPNVIDIGTAAELTEGGSLPQVLDALGSDNLGVPVS